MLKSYRCHSGFRPRRSKSASGYGPPFADLNPLQKFPSKHRLCHICQLILFASFSSMFFSIITQHSSIKVKKNSYFVPILPHLLKRVVQYTQELDANKLLHSNYWNCYNKSLLPLMRINIDTKRHNNSGDYCVHSQKNSAWFSKIITSNSFWTRTKKLLLLQVVHKAYDK